MCSPADHWGKCSGDWVPVRSWALIRQAARKKNNVEPLVFETPPLDAPIEILGAAIVALDVASDRPIANLADRLWPVHPYGNTLVSAMAYSISLIATDTMPTPLAMENATGCASNSTMRARCCRRAAGARPIHGLLADDLAEPREGDAADFRVGRSICLYARPMPRCCCRRYLVPSRRHLEKPTIIRHGGLRVERIDRIGLELGTESKSRFHVEEDDPLTALVELQQALTMSRHAWQICIQTQMRLSCTHNAFLLPGRLRACEGANEVCRREWDRSIPRDLI